MIAGKQLPDKDTLNKLLAVSRFSSALNACRTTNEVFRLTCDVCYELCPGIVAVSDYDETTQTYGMAYSKGLDKYLNSIRAIAGDDIMKKRVPASKIENDIAVDFHSPHLQVIPDGLYSYVLKQFPRFLCKAIEKIIGIKLIYSKAFYYDSISHGTLSLMVDREIEPEILKIADMLADSTTLVLHRMKVEKRVLESEKKYRLLAENTRDVIWTMDLNLKFTYVSPSSIFLTGYTAEEQLSNPVESFLPPASLKMMKEVFAQEMVNEQLPGSDPTRTRILEFQEYTKDGSIIWVEGQMSFLRDDQGRATGIVGVSRNISERKSVNKDLESFTHSVSHDLRTPLRAIDGFTNILIEDYNDVLDAGGMTLLNGIIQNTHKMGGLIDDLLEFAGTGMQKLRYVRIDVKKLIQSIISEIAPEGLPERVQINIMPLPMAWGDRHLIRQLMFNLISNAIKFSNTKETSIIEIGGREDSENLVYYVRDNGVGFDMKYENKLFKVFQRLHPLEQFEGTGVGLAIVSEITQKHGGCVWAEGTKGEGAVFSFSLPRQHYVKLSSNENTNHTNEETY